ncbi:MAG: LacI family DNA-binding transcriptional regulator [Candidatus Acidiferrales bacterium]
MPTIKEVAKRARVSVGSVSHVLTGAASVGPERRERILTAMRELNYHPNDIARSLKLSRSHMLGMVVSDVTNPFFSQLVRGAEDAAMKRNYLLVTFNTDDQVEREMNVVNVLQKRRVDGVLLVVAPSHGKPYHIIDLMAMGTPVVCLDRVPRGVRVDSVTVDNLGAARNCVDHLLDQGHRRIAILTGSLLLQTARARLRGYKEALSRRRVAIDSGLICEGNFRMDSGYQLALSLLGRSDPPTALFVSNGLMAIGVMKALGQMGLRCPQDVALASFDDLALAEVLHPPLTAVVQPAYDIGYQGAILLMQRIESGEKNSKSRPAKVRLATELKVRGSTMRGA